MPQDDAELLSRYHEAGAQSYEVPALSLASGTPYETPISTYKSSPSEGRGVYDMPNHGRGAGSGLLAPDNTPDYHTTGSPETLGVGALKTAQAYEVPSLRKNHNGVNPHWPQRLKPDQEVYNSNNETSLCTNKSGNWWMHALWLVGVYVCT